MKRWNSKSKTSPKAADTSSQEAPDIRNPVPAKTAPKSYIHSMHGINSSTAPWILGILILCVLLTALNVFELSRMQRTGAKKLDDIISDITTRKAFGQKRRFIIYGKRSDTSHLKHVLAVLDRLGFVQAENDTDDWDLLWAHDYPFRALYPKLRNLRSHQKVNHFPGSGYITNKVDLATSDLPHIPPAFKVPVDNEKLLQYAEDHPEVQFVQKSNSHRGIRIQKLNDLDLDTPGTFVQQYIDNPLLIDGHKFDIGIYTTLTSIDPLRVYIYNGDVLLRFCPQKYHPFNSDILDKYVIGDDYQPTWEMPSLKNYYTDLGHSMKESLNAYLRKKGEDPNKLWNQIEEAISEMFLKKEHLLVESASHYRSKKNFFEMVRIDFMVDDKLNVYVMEANMSPNLSSAHFIQNRLLYEQVLYNVLSLVGIGHRLHSGLHPFRSPDEISMEVADKNVAVFSNKCATERCRNCLPAECQLCHPCLTPNSLSNLKAAYLEHINRLDCKRVFPPPMTQQAAQESFHLEEFSPENQLMWRWFQGKCLMDAAWCV